MPASIRGIGIDPRQCLPADAETLHLELREQPVLKLRLQLCLQMSLLERLELLQLSLQLGVLQHPELELGLLELGLLELGLLQLRVLQLRVLQLRLLKLRLSL
jgi:hypothetical protein